LSNDDERMKKIQADKRTSRKIETSCWCMCTEKKRKYSFKHCTL